MGTFKDKAGAVGDAVERALFSKGAPPVLEVPDAQSASDDDTAVPREEVDECADLSSSKESSLTTGQTAGGPRSDDSAVEQPPSVRRINSDASVLRRLNDAAVELLWLVAVCCAAGYFLAPVQTKLVEACLRVNAAGYYITSLTTSCTGDGVPSLVQSSDPTGTWLMRLFIAAALMATFVLPFTLYRLIRAARSKLT